MSKIKVCFVEDEQVNVTTLSLILEGLGYEISGVAMDYKQAVEMLDSEDPDIVLVDIMLGEEKDGILLGHLLKNEYKKPFIFITSLQDKDTINKATSVSPDAYLTKPYNEAEIYAAIQMALKSAAKKKENSPPQNNLIFIKDEYKYIKLDFSEIRYIKAEGNYIQIHTPQKSVMVRSTLAGIMNKIPASKFKQTHKSFIINLDHIDSITGSQVILADEHIPLSRNYKEQLIAAIKLL